MFKPSAPVPLENVVLEYSDVERRPDFSKASKDAFDKVEAQVEEDIASGKLVNRKNLHLDRFVCDGNKLVIVASYARHASYVTYRNLLYKQAIPLQPGFNLFSTIIPTITNDGWQVFGFRTGNHLSGRYLSPAGFCDFDTSPCPNYFAVHTAEETREELGVFRPGRSHFVGISFDDSHSFLSCAVVHTALVHSREYVERMWTASGNKEHDHLIYLKDDVAEFALFMCKKLEAIVNPEKEIFISNGKVNTSGSKKPIDYNLIDNGISAWILDVFARHGAEKGSFLVKELIASGNKIIFGMP